MPRSLPTIVGAYFYPRPPRGGRRAYGLGLRYEGDISIHALREEGDFCTPRIAQWEENFYPRPPRGGRHIPPPRSPDDCCISIHALREEGDLMQRRKAVAQVCISIHALREEGDGSRPAHPHTALQFLSTPSARRATDTV